MSPARVAHFKLRCYFHSSCSEMFLKEADGKQNSIKSSYPLGIYQNPGELKVHFYFYNIHSLRNAWSELSGVHYLLHSAAFTLVSLSNTFCSLQNWTSIFSPGVVILSGIWENSLISSEQLKQKCTYAIQHMDTHTEEIPSSLLFKFSNISPSFLPNPSEGY